MLTIRKPLLVAAALALTPAFAFAQNATDGKAPAAVTATRSTAATPKDTKADTKTPLAKTAKTHTAKVTKAKTAKLSRHHKLAKASRHHKIAKSKAGSTMKTAGTVMKATPAVAQK